MRDEKKVDAAVPDDQAGDDGSSPDFLEDVDLYEGESAKALLSKH